MTVRALVLAQFVETPSWAGFEEGRAAYERVDHPTAFEEWLPLAEQGMPEAQGLLGTTDLAGRGAPQDYVQAEAWFRKAAAQGGPSAQFYLGHLFREGKGVPQNGKEAVRWQPRSAEQDSASAQHRLAITYRQGQGVSFKEVTNKPGTAKRIERTIPWARALKRLKSGSHARFS